MGLDMYAHKRHNVKQWEHEREDERYSVQVTRGGKPVTSIKPERIAVVEEDVMYWRKANHIHGWFVDNVQDGVDNCADYYVSKDKLRELLELCEKVIKASKLVEGQIHNGDKYENQKWTPIMEPGKVIEDATVAKELLPIREGFFFGGKEYDEWYLSDVIETRDWLNRTFKEIDEGSDASIYYSSSW